MNDVNSLTHTSWNCKYHIVFAPKYRRKVFYGQKRREIGEILCGEEGLTASDLTGIASSPTLEADRSGSIF